MLAALHHSNTVDTHIGAAPIRWEAWAIAVVSGMAMWIGIISLFV